LRIDPTEATNWASVVHLSFLLNSLPLSFEEAVRQAAELGFEHIDVVALGERPASHLEALADSGLLVSCGAIGKGLPAEFCLDAAALAWRRQAVEKFQKHIADAARLGASHCYLVPGEQSGAGLACFTEACRMLADFAAARMVRLCVEHVPGRALPTAAATLDWLEQAGHDNLFLLVDIGHCLISGEDPAGVVRQAGPRLGYVHLDDNDGRQDLHWPLLAGRLTEATLTQFLRALQAIGYNGPLALELNSANPRLADDLRQGKQLLHRLLAGLPIRRADA
jgi:sugar phosphate isomerase/epimerase